MSDEQHESLGFESTIDRWMNTTEATTYVNTPQPAPAADEDSEAAGTMPPELHEDDMEAGDDLAGDEVDDDFLDAEDDE